MIKKIISFQESSATSNVTAHFGDWFGLTKSDSVFDLTKVLKVFLIKNTHHNIFSF